MSPAWTRGVRALFFAYLITLFLATHWPGVRIEGPIPRPDLFVHVGAFGLLGVLLVAAHFFGPMFGARNLRWSWGVGVAYAAFDEGTQAIPALQRFAAWDDFLMNVVGVTLAVGGAWLIGRWRAAR